MLALESIACSRFSWKMPAPLWDSLLWNECNMPLKWPNAAMPVSIAYIPDAFFVVFGLRRNGFVGRGAEISLFIHCEIVTPDSALLLGSTHNLPQPLSKDHRWLFNQEMEDTRQAKYANQINWEIAELQMASTDINQSK
jgi:hypothetical protein